MVICLEQGADLHMAQLIALPLTVSYQSKIQIGFAFLVPAHLRSPGQRAVKPVCVCVKHGEYHACNQYSQLAAAMRLLLPVPHYSSLITVTTVSVNSGGFDIIVCLSSGVMYISLLTCDL